MANNSLSIYAESGNIFYQNFNTSKNLYSFLLAQKSKTNKFKNESPTVTALKNIFKVVYLRFL